MKLKRLLVSCVAVAMTVSLVPAVVFASESDESGNTTVIEATEPETKQAEAVAKLGSQTPVSGKCGKNVKYNIDVSTGVITFTGSGTMSNFKGNTAPWAQLKDKITGVTFRGSITSIGNYAFYGCTNLKAIWIPSSVATVGEGAFYGCKGLKSVTGGAGLTMIKTAAFKGCSALTTCKITSTKLKKIGSYAFKSSGLKTLYIQKTSKLTKAGVKKSLKGSNIKTVKVKKGKKLTYTFYFLKGNSGKGVYVKS